MRDGASPTSGPPGGQSVGQLLLQVCRLVGDQMRVRMEGLGLHRAQGFALFFLGHHEGVTQSEIARAFHLSPASVTNMLQRMERDGWILRTADPSDQRISRVYLTPKARELHRDAHETFRDVERDVMAALTKTEQDELRALLGKIQAELVKRLPPGRQPGFPFSDSGGEES